MSQKILLIPTLSDKKADFKKLFALAHDIKLPFDSFYFDFSKCDSLRPNAVALLGGIARLALSQDKYITFGWETLKDKPKTTLCQNGFAGTFGYSAPSDLQDAIPYREDKTKNMNSIMDYLTDFWLGRGWLHVSEKLRNAIVEKMWEIYDNVFEHSDGPVSVFSCGEHIQDDLLLTVVDFGTGIPKKVHHYFLNKDPHAAKLKPSDYLEWAFQPGNSTSMERVARGLGLDLLQEFVRTNRGKLEVYSNDGYVVVDQEGVRYVDSNVSFDGTVVHITLRCDEKLYHFKDETNPRFLT